MLAMLHHENLDGSGYPYGLEGNDIEYLSRISRVVDVYNALISHRPYGSAVSDEKACGVMREEMEGVFDTDILDSFFEFLWSANSNLGKGGYCSLSNLEISQPAFKDA